MVRTKNNTSKSINDPSCAPIAPKLKRSTSPVKKKKKYNYTKKTGRPPIYNPDVHPELAYELCCNGATDALLAKAFKVSVSTIELWGREYSEFIRAVKDGKEIANAHIVRSLYERAKGYSHPDVHISHYKGDVEITPITKHYPPDVGAASLFLFNRTKQNPDPAKRWTVAQSIDHTSSDGSMTPQNNIMIGLPPKQEIEMKQAEVIEG